MQKKRKWTWAALAVVGLGAASVATGVASYEPAGICFGLCEAKQEEDFLQIFDAWLRAQVPCADSAQRQRDVLERIYPGIGSRIEATNMAFSALAAKDAAGNLTVGERELYLDDPWKVSSEQRESRTIKHCSKNGFKSGKFELKYCENYVELEIFNAYGNNRKMELYRFFISLQHSGNLWPVVTSIREFRSRDLLLWRQAREHVEQLPASSVSHEWLDRAIDNRHAQLRCEAIRNDFNQ